MEDISLEDDPDPLFQVRTPPPPLPPSAKRTPPPPPPRVESPDTIHRAQPCQDLLGESWPYFPERCRGRGESSAKVQRDQGIDGRQRYL